MCDAAKFFCATIKLPAIIQPKCIGLQPIPISEPATVSLLAMGLLGLKLTWQIACQSWTPGKVGRVVITRPGRVVSRLRLPTPTGVANIFTNSDQVAAMASNIIIAATVPCAFKEAFSTSRNSGPGRT